MIWEKTIERLQEIERRCPTKTYSQELIKELSEEFGISTGVIYRNMRMLKIKPEPRASNHLSEIRKTILEASQDGKLPRGFINQLALKQGVSRQRMQQIAAKLGISGTIKVHPDTKDCGNGHTIPYVQKTCRECINQTYTCTVCSKQFKRRAKMVTHMQKRVKSKMNVYCSHACRNMRYKARLDI